MPPGPPPKPDARRRNAPTIATTALPPEGRQGPAPDCPYELGKKGREWWEWAWHTPQAAAWDPGALYVVARRAQLEDSTAIPAPTAQMLQLDDRLGLTPKAMVAMRWRIGGKTQAEVAAEAAGEEAPVVPANVSSIADRRLKARIVDPEAVGG